MPEMIFIFLLALILFGPKKLPEIGREIGKFMAEFKRASNDFKYQLQTEIENAGADVAPTAASTGAQQSSSSSSFTQTLIPPAVSSVMSEIDNAHDRLMKTARMAFEAQNFTLRPPDTPTVSSTYPESLSAPSPSDHPVATSSPAAPVSAETVSHEASPVEAANDQPSLHSAPAKSDSASQNS